jgi:formate hydrogenlyase subunit 3/multisubunit Na+/H+ antiporter MnhD subunit
MTASLLLATLGVPLGLALVSVFGLGKNRSRGVLWLAPLPALALVLFGRPFPAGPGAVFVFDTPSVLLLGSAAILWLLAGWTAWAMGRVQPLPAIFLPCWLLTMTGSFGVFLVTDLIGFLVCYALVSLPAYGLVVAAGTPEASRAGRLYLAFALVGENILLLGFVLLAQSPANPQSALPLLLAGFGLKIALVPFHFWMPAAHAAASVPASAVLSGIVVKAGIIGLLRFVPFDVAAPVAGETLAAFGFVTAFFGVLAGLGQVHPKKILGYSSVSQMGFLAAVIGLGLAAGDPAVVPLAAFYAANHVLVKGALFLAVGCQGAGRAAWVPALLPGLALSGLPLTGGALAKLAVKDPLGGGLTMVLATCSAIGTAMLMLHFVFCLRAGAAEASAPGGGRCLAWWLAAAFALVFPWLFLGEVPLTAAEVLSGPSLGKTLWPVAAGAVLFAVLRNHLGRRRMPAWDSFRTALIRPATGLFRALVRGEAFLRDWPLAGTLVVLLVLALIAALRLPFR